VSHYIKVKTKFKDAAALVQALREQFPNSTIEELTEPKAIRRYDKKAGHPCTIIVRKSKAGEPPVTDAAGKYLQPFYGDLGFALEEDGTFAQHADDLDLGRGSGSALAQCYARIVTVKQAKLSGFTVNEVKAADGTITLNLSKWS
jgi:hypothetical protein